MQRIQLVDALRGLAALAVVFFHFGLRIGWKNWGNLGVPVFFVLSGFVISMSIGARRISLAYAGRFALRRSIRLDPPYWLSIAAVVIVGMITVHFGFKPKPVSWPQMLAHVFYLQDFLGYLQIQSVYWTLCYEIQFYLALLFLLWGAGNSSSATGVLAATIMLSLLDNHLAVTHHAFMGNDWFCFAIGVSVHRATQGLMPARFFWLFLAAIAIVGVATAEPYAITASLTALVLFFAISRGHTRWGSHPALQFLGRISYSLYLTHLIFGWVAMGVARHFVPDPVALAFGVMVAVGSAWIYFRLIERPAVNWSRRFTSGSSPELSWPEKPRTQAS